MSALHGRLPEAALNATVVLALAMLVHETAVAENAGCTNNTCKNIFFYRDCHNNSDFLFKLEDCLPCKNMTNGGRCDIAANNLTCGEKTDPQFFKQVTTTEVCNCQNAPANGNAERTGTYIDGNWTDTNTKQHLCPPPNPTTP